MPLNDCSFPEQKNGRYLRIDFVGCEYPLKMLGLLTCLRYGTNCYADSAPVSCHEMVALADRGIECVF